MPRLPRSDFAVAPEMFQDEPVIVEEVLSLPKCQEWLTHISKRSLNEPVQVERQKHGSSSSSSSNGNKVSILSLTEATELLKQYSSHTNPICISSLGSSCSTDQLPLYDTLEDLFVVDYDTDDTMDWFACLGRHAPIHDTLTILGTGATAPSQISSVPYTKLLLCLKGSLLIRAIPPSTTPASSSSEGNSALQQQQQKEPIWADAWDGFSFSMGSQLKDSNLSLFAYRHQDVVDTTTSTSRGASTGVLLQEWANSPHYLCPNFNVVNPPKPVVKQQSQGATINKNDIKMQENDLHDHDSDDPWHSSVLLPGNLAVIPPGWWFQTYNAEPDTNTPAVCLQSQRCGGSNRGVAMVQHILFEAAGGSDDTAENQLRLLLDVEGDGVGDGVRPENGDDYYYTMEEAQDIVLRLFTILGKQEKNMP